MAGAPSSLVRKALAEMIGGTPDAAARAEEQGWNALGDWYHATTHTIKEGFQNPTHNSGNSLYEPMSYHGPAIYLTNDTDDAARNYAGFGPDLTNRIERTKESLANDFENDERNARFHHDVDDEEEIDDTLLERLARQHMGSDHEGATIRAKINLKNPVHVGRRDATRWDIEHPYDEENDEYGEPTGPGVKLIESAIDELGRRGLSDRDLAKVSEKLWEHASDYEGIDANEFEKIMRDEPAIYAEDDDGRMVNGQVIQDVYRDLGHDGVILHNPAQTFGMGLTPDTKHAVVFDPQNVRAAHAAFDPAKRNSRDLLAGAGATLTGAALLRRALAARMSPDDQEGV